MVGNFIDITEMIWYDISFLFLFFFMFSHRADRQLYTCIKIALKRAKSQDVSSTVEIIEKEIQKRSKPIFH